MLSAPFCRFQGRKNNININISVRIFRRHSWPLRPDARGSKKVSRHHRGRRETQLLVRTSKILERTPMAWRILEKLCIKSLHCFLAPMFELKGSMQCGPYLVSDSQCTSSTMPWSALFFSMNGCPHSTLNNANDIQPQPWTAETARRQEKTNLRLGGG